MGIWWSKMNDSNNNKIKENKYKILNNSFITNETKENKYKI